MGVNEIIYFGRKLIDLKDLTVTPDKLLKGVTAVNAAGDIIVGTLELVKKYSVIFQAAPNETVTISGPTSLSAIAGSSGLTTPVTLEEGLYTVLGSVSGYTHTVRVDHSGTYFAFPTPCFYWFGWLNPDYTPRRTGDYLNKPFMRANELYVDAGQQRYASILFNPKISRGSATRMKAVARLNSEARKENATIGLSTSGTNGGNSETDFVAFTHPAQDQVNVKSTYSVNLSGLNQTAQYIIQLKHYGNEFYLYALWLE